MVSMYAIEESSICVPADILERVESGCDFGIAVATIDVSSINRKTTRTIDTNTLSSVRPVRYAASSFLGGDEAVFGSLSILVVLAADMLTCYMQIVLCVWYDRYQEGKRESSRIESCLGTQATK